MTSFVVSEAAGRAADTHRCTVNTDWTDGWDSKQAAPGMSSLSEPSVACRALRSVFPQRLGSITSLDALAVPSDVDCGAKGHKFVAAYAQYYSRYSSSAHDYLYARDTTITLHLWDYTDDHYNSATRQMTYSGAMPNTKGSVALAHDGSGDVHVFWTEWVNGDSTHRILHGKYNASGADFLDTATVGNAWVTNPDDGAATDVINPVHIISAAYDDDIAMVRVTWPENDSGNAKLKAGRYRTVNHDFVLVKDLASSSNSVSKRRFNSIAYADYCSSGTPPAWLKSKDLKMENFVASNADAWGCLTETNDDTWTAKLARGEFSLDDSTSNSQPTAACRGLRLPRYVGRG